MIEKKNLLTTIVHFFPGSNTKNNESFIPGLSWLNKEFDIFLNNTVLNEKTCMFHK